MKRKKSLQLKKETITNLNKLNLLEVKGGTQVISAPTGRELECNGSNQCVGTRNTCKAYILTENCISESCPGKHINLPIM